jgi:hypothetical protein
MISRSIRFSLLAAMAAFSLAACAAPAPATPDPAAATPALPTPDTPAVTPEPATPEPREPVTPEPPTGNGDQVLRDLFPTSVAGQPISPQVFTIQQLIDEFGAEGEDLDQVTAFLATVGRGAGDVSVAFASFSIDGEFVQLEAFRAPGVGLQQLIAAAVQLAEADLGDFGDETEVTQATVGGKSVTVVQYVDSFEEDERAYLYGVGDVVFQIEATPEIAEVVLAELP